MNLWTEYGIAEDHRNPPMAMDLRHVTLLHKSLLATRPRIAVEIGSHKGHSTAAFLKAMDDLPDMQVHIFEPHLTPELACLMAASRHNDRIFHHPEAVWGYDIDPDFAFIDGDHGLSAMADLAFCLSKQATTIAMHDTEGRFDCWGSKLAADMLCGMKDRMWLSDAKPREGEFTHRGFGVSYRRPSGVSVTVEQELMIAFSQP